MKLKDMTVKTPQAKPAPAAQDSSYPYGLRLTLNKVCLEKLPRVRKLDVDTPVKIQAIGRVIETTRRSCSDIVDDMCSEMMVIQIERLSIGRQRQTQQLTTMDETINKVRQSRRQ